VPILGESTKVTYVFPFSKAVEENRVGESDFSGLVS